MGVEDECALCGLHLAESLQHLFIECPWSKAAWFAHPMGIITDAVREGFLQWFTAWCIEKKPEDLALLFQGTWTIWKARNDHHFNGKLADPTIAMQRAISSLLELTEAQGHDQSPWLDNAVRVWNPPPPNKLKVNFDAGWTGNSETGFGLIIRDHESRMMAATTHMEPFRLDPTVAEAMALRWCLSTIAELGLEDVLIESDSQMVIKAMQKQRSKPDMEPIIQDFKFLAQTFSSISYSHVNRQANNAAHVWWESPLQLLQKPFL